MKPSDFLDRLDDAKVVEAIGRAERGTTGEIRVFVSRRTLDGDDILQRAAARFRLLELDRTPDRNAVLLYFLPRERKFAVIGDRGFHAKCPPSFWQDVADAIAGHLREDRFTEAVLAGIGRVGDLLAQHFPAGRDDLHSHPDQVVRD